MGGEGEGGMEEEDGVLEGNADLVCHVLDSGGGGRGGGGGGGASGGEGQEGGGGEGG